MLTQTLRPTEVIVVADDCSDRTAEIAERLGVIVLKLKKRNISAARNMGINTATQPWIAFQDADDFWDSEKLSLQWQAISSCPGIGMVCSDCLFVLDGKVIPPPEVPERWKNYETLVVGDKCRYLKNVTGEFLTRFFLPVPSVLLPREVFAGVGLFDESLTFGQALEFFARVLARYPLAYVERPLVYVRSHDGNSTRNVAATWPAHVQMVDRMLKFPDKYPGGTGEAYRNQLKRNFLKAERVVARRHKLEQEVG